jgi:hypothetical protein
MKILFPELKQKPLHKEMRSIIIRIQIIIRVAVNNWFMHFFLDIFFTRTIPQGTSCPQIHARTHNTTYIESAFYYTSLLLINIYIEIN